MQTDLVVDLMADRTDIAVRAGPMKSSSLVARKLGDTAMMIVGSPDYLARAGTPRTLADLEGTNGSASGYVGRSKAGRCATAARPSFAGDGTG